MENKAEIAHKLFKEKGLNCSQSVFLAFSKDYGLSDDMAFKISIGFGAGMGRLREVCGALSGAFMVIGLAFGDRTKKEVYELEQEFALAFKADNGSYICRDLLNLRKDARLSPVPEERTPAYYEARPCDKLVHYTAEKLQQFLQDKQ